MKKVLVFDVETTGLPRRGNGAVEDSSNWPYVVQIAWILFDENAKELHRADYIIKPNDFYIPLAMTAVHGISQDYAMDNGVDANLVFNTFYEVLSDNNPILIGHNVKFDIGITRAEFHRKGIEDIIATSDHICTMQMAMQLMKNKGVKFPKLSEIYFHLFKTDFIGHHRAMADVEATAKVYFELQKIKAAGQELDYALLHKGNSYSKPPTEVIELDLDKNTEFKIAFDWVKHTKESLFLTGKAGTGKSTFLKYVLSKINKNIIVVAPTGIAALNVGGVTIHSFFRLPFRPILPDDEEIPDLGFVKKKLIKAMDTIIIDEVSMVRVDVIDAIDKSLRLNGGNPNQAFGGKQVIFIGDIFQLEPVIEDKNGSKEIIMSHYESVYFFKSRAFNSLTNLKIIELKKVYRQKEDQSFLKLLDKCRLNQLKINDLNAINTRVEDAPSNPFELFQDQTIILKTTNYEADQTNQSVLNCIDNPIVHYQGMIYGKFGLAGQRLPAPEHLQLKLDAQVMLLKNDLHGRWVNGTLATICKIEQNFVAIKLKNGEEHVVDKYTWENVNYKYNSTNHKIETEVIGSFTQYPLRLAWAITIHKSQGLTFDKIKIDWGAKLFASGQVYVALSRCKTLDGISMSRALINEDIIVNQELIDYYTEVICHEAI